MAKPITIRIGFVEQRRVEQSLPVFAELESELSELEQLVYFLGGNSELWPLMPRKQMEAYHRDQAMVGLIATSRAVLKLQTIKLASEIGGFDILLDKASIYMGIENAKAIDLTDALLERIGRGDLENLSDWKAYKSVAEIGRQYLAKRGNPFMPDVP